MGIWRSFHDQNASPASRRASDAARQARGSGRKRRSSVASRRLTIEQFEWRLVLNGPQLISIIPDQGSQLLPGETLNVAPSQLTFSFDQNQTINGSTLNGIILTRSGGDGVFGNSNDVRIFPGSLAVGAEPNQVVMRFSSPLPADLYQIEIVGAGPNAVTNTQGQAFNNAVNYEQEFRLDLAPQVLAVVPQPVSPPNANNVRTQAVNEIDVYFSEPLDPTSAETTSLYQLIATQNTSTTADDQTITPQAAIWNSANDEVRLIFSQPLSSYLGSLPNESFRLRIGNDQQPQQAPIVVPVPPSPQNPATPNGTGPGDTFATAMALPNEGGGAGLLGNGQTEIFNSSINPLPVNTALVFPGGSAPGVPNLPVPIEPTDPSLPTGALSGIAQWVQEEGVMNHILDGQFTSPGGVVTIPYNFKTNYGTDPSGKLLTNQIASNPTWEPLIRDIFGLISKYTGVSFVETPSSGLTVAVGSILAVGPSDPATAANGIEGPTSLAPAAAIINGNVNWGNATYGGAFFDVAMDEILHALGLGTAYDAPGSMTGQQGNENPGPNQGAAPQDTNQMFPGNPDIQTLQYLYRENSTQVSLYKFTVTQQGTINAETFAQRLTPTSQLDTLLTMYDELSVLGLPTTGGQGVNNTDNFTIQDNTQAKTFEFTYGASIQVPASLGGGADIADNSTFSLSDGIDPPVTFEFAANGRAVTDGNIPIPFNTTDSLSTVAGDIVQAINEAVKNNGLGGGKPQITASYAGNGLITLGAQLTLSDWSAGSSTLTFTPALTLGAGAVPIFFAPSDTPHQLAVAIADAINSSGLNVLATAELTQVQLQGPITFPGTTTGQNLPNAPGLSLSVQHDIVARNDNYFGNDSFISLTLQPGVYYVAVSSAGNDQFDPDIANSGWGGTTSGMYELRLNFQTTAATAGALVSAVAPVGTGLNVLGGDAPQPLDGAGNGVPGSTYNFWFNVGPTTFVDKLGDQVQPATMNLDGSVGPAVGAPQSSFTTIQAALAANPTPGSNLRIEGNGGAILQVPINQSGSNAIVSGQSFSIGAGTAAGATATFEFFDGDSIHVTGGGSAVPDGSTFTISVGTNPLKSVTFEFAQGGHALAAGDTNQPIAYNVSDSNATLALEIVNAINAAVAAGLFGSYPILASYSGLMSGNAVISLGDKVPAAVAPATVATSGSPPLTFVAGTPTTLYPGVTAVYYPAGSNGTTIGQQIVAAINTTPLIDPASGNLVLTPSSDANNFYLTFTEGPFTSAGNASNRVTINTAGQNAEPGTPDLTTIYTDQAYQIGINNAANNNAPLADGSTFNVPRGVTVMVDPGAEFKLRQAIIDVGSNAQNINRSEGALQVLGVPGNQVIFTSFNDNSVGGTLESPITAPAPGDWGGLVFQQDSGLEPLGIFLNYVDEAVLRYGGGKVLVNGVQQPFDPIEMVTSRPTVTNNIIVQSAQAPISGDPNSFQETHYQQDITILAPSGAQITNGQTFSIHGTNFEFQNENSPTTLGVQAGYIPVPYNGIPQNDPNPAPKDNANQVAVEIAAAINGAQLTAPITQAAVTGNQVTVTSVALDSAVALDMTTPPALGAAPVSGSTANLAGSTFAVKSGVFEFFDGDSLQLLASGSETGLDKSTFTITMGGSSVTFEFAINERPVTDGNFAVNFNQTDSIATLGQEITGAVNAAAQQGLFGVAPISASYSGAIGTGPAVISLGDLPGTTVTFNFQPSLPPTALTFLGGSASMTLAPNDVAVHFALGDSTSRLAQEIAAAINGAQIDGGTGALVYAEAVNAVDGSTRVDIMNSSDINLSSPGAAPLTLTLLSPLAVQPTSGANLNDGESFAVNGQVFEYDQGTTITPPRSGGAGVINGDSFTITDGATGANVIQFVFYVNYQGFFQTPPQLPTLQANQRAVFVNSANPLNQNFFDVLATLTGSQALGAQFTLTTGTTATTFEITDGSLTLAPGILPVLVNPADNAGTIAQKISAAINATNAYTTQVLGDQVQVLTPAFPTTITISTDAPSKLLVSVVPGTDTPAQVGNDILQAILGSGLADLAPGMLAGPSGAVRIVSTGSVLPVVNIAKAAELTTGTSLNGGISVPFAPGFSAAQVATSIATSVTTAGIGVSATAGIETTITAPASGASGITSGDSFTVTEGANTAKFTLLATGSTVPAGSFPVFYSSGDTQQTIAQTISTAINAAATAGVLTNLTATPAGGVVQLITASGGASSVNVSLAPELAAGPSTPIVTFQGADSVVPLGPSSTDATQIAITAPTNGAAGITSGDSFTITAGTSTATFVLLPTGSALPSDGFPVYYSASDTKAVVAQEIYSAIYSAVATGTLTNLRATASGGVVQLVATGTSLSVNASSAPELTVGASTPVVTYGGAKSGVPLTVPSFTMNTDAAPLGLLNNFYTADYERAGPDIHGNILAVRQPQILSIANPTQIADGEQFVIGNVGFQFSDNNQTAPGFIPVAFTTAQLTAPNAADLAAQDVLSAIENADNPSSPFFQAGFNVQPVLGPAGSGQVLLLLDSPSIYAPSIFPLGTTLLNLPLNAVPVRILGTTPLTVRQPVNENTTNGLFVGTPSLSAQTDENLDVTAVFASTDITYVITENLNLTGEPGGALGTVGRESARLQLDPGVIVKLHTAYINVGMGANLVAESDPNHQIIFTSLFDDTVGSGGTFFANGDDQNPSGAQPVAPGDWGGLYFSPTSSGSLDYVTVNYGGGQAPVGGGFVPFDPVEIHQAQVRITDSVIQNSGNGATTSDRNGLGPNADPVTFGPLTSGVIYVLNAQPVIVNDIIQNNAIPVTTSGMTTFVGGAAISINADSLNDNQVPDWGRSTGPINRFSQFDDNRGPLVRLDKLGNNAINGMLVRGGMLTTNSVWDDTDIVHVVESDLKVGNGLTMALESSPTQSLVVKLTTVNSASLAGLTATGTPNDVTGRIGGTLQILGQPGHPVVLTALTDCTVGAGLTPANGPDNETDNGNCGTPASIGGSGPVFVDGGDIDKHGDNLGPGGANEGGWLLIQEALKFLYDGSRNTSGTGILVIGSSTGSIAQQAVMSAAAADGLPAPTFITGSAISTVNFAQYRMVYVPSTDPQTPGGISQADLDLLTARKTDIQTYVNNTGGGLMALTEVSSPTPFAWLALPSLFQTSSYGAGGNLDPLVGTPALTAAGFNISTTDLNLGTPWHEGFDGPPGFDNMQPFIVDAVTGEVEALGLPAGSSGIGGTGSAPGTWNTIAFDQYANDTNVATINEQESAFTGGNGVNNTPGTAEFLGQLAPNLASGSDSQRLGFQVNGSISLNDSHDIDTYSFTAVPGTQAWFDVGQTSPSLDTVLELVDANGNVLARSDSAALEEQDAINAGNPLMPGPMLKNELPPTSANPAGNLALPLESSTFTGGVAPAQNQTNFGSINPKDPGFRVILPGSGTSQTYYVRIYSRGPASSNNQYLPNLGPAPQESNGLSSGLYTLQIRLQQQEMSPGSTVSYADIRFATNGITVLGQPADSPLLGNSAAAGGNSTTNISVTSNNIPQYTTGQPNGVTNSQDLGNLLTTPSNSLTVTGNLQNPGQVDWYKFSLNYNLTQAIQGINAGDKTWSTIFDVGYADGLTRPDTTISVFDQWGNLILNGRSSDVADQQPTPTQGQDTTNLSHSSFGTNDPFIGPAQLPAGVPGADFPASGSTYPLPIATDPPPGQGTSSQNGPDSFTYFVAISSAATLPVAMDAQFNAASNNTLVRLQPVDSTQYIVNDHIGYTGFTSGNAGQGGGTQILPQDGPVLPIKTIAQLQQQVQPYTLDNMSLYVSTGTTLYTADPANGAGETLVNPYPLPGSLGGGQMQDIAIRTDGLMFGYADDLTSDSDSGHLLQINPGTAQITDLGGDGAANKWGTNKGPGQVGALAYYRLPGAQPNFNNWSQYHLFLAANNPEGGSDILYANVQTGDTTATPPYFDTGALPTGVSVIQGIATGAQIFAHDTATATYTPSSFTITDTQSPANTIQFFFWNSSEPVPAGLTIGKLYAPGTDPLHPSNTNYAYYFNYGTNDSSQTILQEMANAIDFAFFLLPNSTFGQEPTAQVIIEKASPDVLQIQNASQGDFTLAPEFGVGVVKSTPGGHIKGMAVDMNNNELYCALDSGAIYEVPIIGGVPVPSLAVYLKASQAFVNRDYQFQGLTLGPQDLNWNAGSPNTGPGDLADVMIGVALDNNPASPTFGEDVLTAFDVIPSALFPQAPGSPVAVFDTPASIPVNLPNGLANPSLNDPVPNIGPPTGTFVDHTALTTPVGVPLSAVTGIALSPLDFNLWHPTFTDPQDAQPANPKIVGDAAGHGVPTAFDNSNQAFTIPGNNTQEDQFRNTVSWIDSGGGQTSVSSPQSEGGANFWFGLDAQTPDYPTDGQLVTAGSAVGSGPLNYTGFNSVGSAGQVVAPQYGMINPLIQADLDSNTSIADTYNLPGGASGSLVTQSFSLSGYSSGQQPTLYFNYFLNTGMTNNSTQGWKTGARVFVSPDGGRTWDEVATNDPGNASSSLVPTRQPYNPAFDPMTGSLGSRQTALGTYPNVLDSSELPYVDTASSQIAVTTINGKAVIDPRQQVQQLYDSTGTWRQARVDLSNYAGDPNLLIRFDVSSSGAIMNPVADQGDTTPMPGDNYADNWGLGLTDNGRENNNQHSGFAVDDILVGLAGRGEMVSGSNLNNDGTTRQPPTDFFTVPQNPTFGAPTQVLTGSYVLQIREGTPAGSSINPNSSGMILNPNPLNATDRLTEAYTLLAPAGHFNQTQTLPDSNQITFQNLPAPTGNGTLTITVSNVLTLAGTDEWLELDFPGQPSLSQKIFFTPQDKGVPGETFTTATVALTLQQLQALINGNQIRLTLTPENAAAGTTIAGNTTVTLDYASDLIQGQTFTISDGVNQRTFQFTDNNQLTNPSYVPVSYTPNDTSAQLAQEMIAAINSPGLFNVYAASGDANNNSVNAANTPNDTSNRVNLFKAAWVWVGPPQVTISNPQAAPPPPPHNTIAAALPTGLNSTTNGVRTFNGYGVIGNAAGIGTSANIDMLQVHLNQGDAMSIALDTKSVLSLLNPVLRVFDSQGTNLTESLLDAAGNSYGNLLGISTNGFVPASMLAPPPPGAPGVYDDYYLTFTAPATGNYYLAVSGAGNATYSPVTADGALPGSTGFYQIHVSVGAVNTRGAGPVANPTELAQNAGFKFGENYSVQTVQQDVNVGVGTSFNFQPSTSADTNVQIVKYDYQGDSTVTPLQGQFILQGAEISNSLNDGILVSAAPREGLQGQADPNLPHQGAVLTLIQANTSRLVPGVSLTNNLIDGFGQAGIQFSGDPNTQSPLAAVPYGRIVNNTIYGGNKPSSSSIGIDVTNSASPTMLNNIVANTGTGISIDASSQVLLSPPVLGENLYQNDTLNTNISVGPQFPTGDPGTNGDVLKPTDPLFVNAAAGNFYLQRFSLAIDSAINSLADRSIFTPVTGAIGIPPLPVQAPNTDIFGQLRVADPNDAVPNGLGANIYKDRGAVERAAFTGPTAELLTPADNGIQDQDPRVNFVHTVGQNFSEFDIELNDGTGPGIDNTTVTASEVTVRRNGVLLTPGIDYGFLYDNNNHIIRLIAAAGVWANGSVYDIALDNGVNFDPLNPTMKPVGIKDLAGNLLQADFPNGFTTFEITLEDNFNDPPAVILPPSAQVYEHDSLVFNSSSSSSNPDQPTFANDFAGAIRIFDVDANGGVEQVTLTASAGVLSITGLPTDGSAPTAAELQALGLTSATGNGTGTLVLKGVLGDATVSPPELGLNYALTQLVYNPDPSANPYFNGAATITLVANDLGNSGPGPAGQKPPFPQQTTVNFSVNVIPVNNPPVNTVPVIPPGPEDTPVTFSQAQGNAISVSDPDIVGTNASNPQYLYLEKLTAIHGTLTLSPGSGVTPAPGSTSIGNGTSSLAFVGTLQAVNTALDGMTFTPDSEYYNRVPWAGNRIGFASSVTPTVGVSPPYATQPLQLTATATEVDIAQGATGSMVNGQTITLTVALGNARTLTTTFEFDSDGHGTGNNGNNVPINVTPGEDGYSLTQDAVQTINSTLSAALQNLANVAGNPAPSNQIGLSFGATAVVTGANLALAVGGSQVNIVPVGSTPATGLAVNGQTLTVSLPIGTGSPLSITFEFDSDNHPTKNVPIVVNALDNAQTMALDAAQTIDSSFRTALLNIAGTLAANPSPSAQVNLALGASAKVSGANLATANNNTQIDVVSGTTGANINGQTFTVTLPVGNGAQTAVTFEFDSDGHSTNNIPIKVNGTDTANTLAQDAASTINAAFTSALQGFADLAGNPTPSNRIGLSAGATAVATPTTNVPDVNLSVVGGAEIDIVPAPSTNGPIAATGSTINGQVFSVTLPVGSGRSMSITFEFNSDAHKTSNVSIVVNPTDTATTLAQDAAAAINAAFTAATPNLSFLASDLSAASITIITNDQGNIGVGPGPLHLPPPVPLTAENVIPLTFTLHNDAPTLDGSTTMTLTPSIYELPAPPSPAPPGYTTANNGTKVSDILATGGSASDNDLHQPITLNAAGAKTGIAITGVDPLSAANGTWQYSLDGGNTWTNFPTVSLSNALLLDASDFVRFVPNNYFIGTPAAGGNSLSGTVNFTFQAWDETQAVNSLNGNVLSLSTGGTADLSTNSSDAAPIGTGGSTPFSTASATAALSIVAVDNTPPTIAPPGSNVTTNEDTPVTLGPITVNDANSFVAAGQFQVSISVSNGINNQPAGTVTLASTNGLTFTSGSNNSAAMTFTGQLGTSSPAAAIDGALSGLVFTPETNFAGQATITINASDEAGSFLGGPLSALPAVFTINVTPVHQAPILNTAQAKNVPFFTSYPENTPPVNNKGGSVLSMLQSGGNIVFDGIVLDKNNNPISNPYVNIDQDAGGQVGIVITQLDAFGTANGTWQYSTNGGTTWLPIAPVSNTNALVLSANDLVRYLPNQNFFGSVKLTFGLWDESNGAVDGSRVNLSGSGATGGNTAYSSATTQATLTVGFVDQPPSFSLQTTSTLENNTAALSGNPAPSNAGVITVPNFAYGVSAGPSNAPGLVIQSFNVTTDSPNLFTATGQPKIVFNPATGNGDLTYQLAPDVFGTAKLTVTATNNGLSDPQLPGATGTDTSPAHFSTISVVGINDPPTFNMTYQSTPLIDTPNQPLPAINLSESASPQSQTVNLSNVTAGLDETQIVNFTVTSSSPALIPMPMISYSNPNTTGTLTFTPVANMSGIATITVTLTDNGGTANGGMNTTTEQFQVNVSSNLPTATPQTSPGVSVIENTPTAIQLQGTDPNNLPLTPIITSLPANGTLYQTADGSTLGAAITKTNTSVTNANGLVIYQPESGEVGSPFDTFQFAVSNGTSTSTPAAVSIAVSLLSPPTFTLGPNPHSADLLSQQSIANFATIQSPTVINPPATPEFTYHVQVTNNAAMFAVAPAISPTGTLTYTLAPNLQPGSSATVSVTLQFTGQVAPGGTATSPATSFAISTNSVPTAANHSFELSVGNSSSATAADGLLVGATGGNGTLVPVVVQQPTNGTLTVNPDGSFTYTKGASFQGFDSFTYEVTDGTSVSKVATVSVISYEATIVQKLYNQVLHRDPDQAGWQFWVSQIQRGASYGTIAQGIFESNEHLDPIIEGYYQQFLFRPADPQGLAYWRDQVWKVYGGPERVVAGMISSPEFYASAGGTNQGWLTALYQRLLGRQPDPQGLAYWVNQLNSGAETEFQVVLVGFESSPEYFTDLVNSYFQEYLGVPPTPSQLSQYVGQFEAGASDRDIQIDIINTPQYANTPPPPSPGTVRLLS